MKHNAYTDFYCKIAAWTPVQRWCFTIGVVLVPLCIWWLFVYRSLHAACQVYQKETVQLTERWNSYQNMLVVYEQIPGCNSVEWSALVCAWADRVGFVFTQSSHEQDADVAGLYTARVHCSGYTSYPALVAFFEGLWGLFPLMKCDHLVMQQDDDELFVTCSLHNVFFEHACKNQLSSLDCNVFVSHDTYALVSPFLEQDQAVLVSGCFHDSNEHITVIQKNGKISIIKGKKPFNLGKLKG